MHILSNAWHITNIIDKIGMDLYGLSRICNMKYAYRDVFIGLLFPFVKEIIPLVILGRCHMCTSKRWVDGTSTYWEAMLNMQCVNCRYISTISQIDRYRRNTINSTPKGRGEALFRLHMWLLWTPFSPELRHRKIIISNNDLQKCSSVNFLAVIMNCLIEITHFKWNSSRCISIKQLSSSSFKSPTTTHHVQS